LSVEALKQWVADRIDASPLLRVEYFEIVDGLTLQPIEEWADSGCPVGCIAVFCGAIRLIDNMKYE